MIKKLAVLIVLITILLVPMKAVATDIDDDGILGAAWNTPATGNVPTGYALSYTINGITDSITAEVIGLTDSSVVLNSVGDWALLNVRSYFEYWSEFQQQAVRVYSVTAVSDTVIFDQIISVDPPTGIHWE